MTCRSPLPQAVTGSYDQSVFDPAPSPTFDRLLMIVFVLVMGVLFINLLVAIMSSTYETVQEV